MVFHIYIYIWILVCIYPSSSKLFLYHSSLQPKTTFWPKKKKKNYSFFLGQKKKEKVNAKRIHVNSVGFLSLSTFVHNSDDAVENSRINFNVHLVSDAMSK
jgi:hypothetical protein